MMKIIERELVMVLPSAVILRSCLNPRLCFGAITWRLNLPRRNAVPVRYGTLQLPSYTP